VHDPIDLAGSQAFGGIEHSEQLRRIDRSAEPYLNVGVFHIASLILARVQKKTRKIYGRCGSAAENPHKTWVQQEQKNSQKNC
jgi:hypothetical protein